MEKIILNANTRDNFGKEANKKLRKSGLVPAVVYKKGKKTEALEINEKDLFHALRTSAGGNAIITLNITNEKKEQAPDKNKTVIIKEMQHGPVKGDVLHVDFHEISLTEKITVNIAIETKGEPEGVKIDGGVLDHPIKEIEIECLPTDIPEKIEVHVEPLKIGDAIKVKDLVVPQGVKVVSDPEFTVLSVMPPRAEEVEEEAEEELAEPEVIKEKKPEAEAEEPQEAQPNEEKKE